MAEPDKNDVTEAIVTEKPKRGRKRKTASSPAEETTPILGNTIVEPADTSTSVTNTGDRTTEPELPAMAEAYTPDASTAEPNALETESAESVLPTLDSTSDEASDAIMAEVEVAPVASNAYSACGGALKAAREGMGMSIQEVCKQLRLSATQIQAIEQDAFDKLPHKSIVRGFIRNYAKLVKVDVTPILAAYQALVPDSSPAALSVKSNASQSIIESSRKRKPFGAWLNPMMLLLVASLLTYFYVVHIKPQQTNTAAQTLDAPEAETIDATVPIEIEATQMLPAAPETTAETAPVTNSVSTDPLANSAEIPPAPEKQVTTMPAVQPQAVDPSSNTTNKPTTTNANTVSLSFKVSEDSWIGVEDLQGKKLFGQMLRTGNEQTISLDKPLNITIGNAAVTKLVVDQQPYDLSAATHGRVARVQLK